ncbi:DNA repair protein RecN [Desulfitobacterium sp.]|uniref:DNA repair protein RecN n=1 Tax=Desulfitobacterium sp. TaxID=49981 RepID=UPI002C2DA745|nr:DNA repair protein RecN [Desulfitobacterium sp.]HVJ47866.1 DNA repair protein RecN [Desulfitobacterium sp.]
MLTEMHVENFALMENVSLNLHPGLTVFTGETGTGKSMLIDALGVLLGGRASTDFIRHGLEKARVEGVFEDLPANVNERLEEAGYPAEEGQLLLYREINANGKNACRVQGRTVPFTLYRSLCQGLVDIHGQMEHQSLFQAETHQGLLDAFGGEEHLQLLKHVNAQAHHYRALLNQENELVLSERDRVQREEMLRYQIGEITRVAPQAGEEEELHVEKKRLGNREKILNLTTELYANLYEGSQGQSIYDLLGGSRKIVQDLARFDDRLEDLIEPFETVYYAVEDLVERVRSYQENLEFEPGRLDQIEERLIQLQRLRKYGMTVEEVLVAKEEMVQELQRITHLQEELEQLQENKKRVLAEYTTRARELTQKRIQVAEKLERGLLEELFSLGLEKSRFEVHFTPVKEPRSGGAEEVEFYFSANLGEPPKPLVKVASGGEMARLMLALKSLLSKIESVGTFVFDEVDSGVGGRTIQKVGEKLAKIAESKQVFCITHSAPVAAFAEEHFGIVKEISGERTRTLVNHLDEAERIEELARMLGGSAEISRQHAEQLWHAQKK